MYPAMKLGIHWLTTDMDQNHDLFPEGYGIMEVYGLNAELIDVAVYTQEALKATARVARMMGEPDSAARYERSASQLAARINERFWVEAESSYADFYGTRAQAMRAAEGAIKQIGLKGSGQLTARDRELIGNYQRLEKSLPRCRRGTEAGSRTGTGSSRRRWKPASLREVGPSARWTRSDTRMWGTTGPFSQPSKDRR